MESELDHFIKTLRKNGTAIWLNTYFNTLQTLLQNLKINSNSPALAMNVTKGFELNSNIGQRWISKPYDGKYIGLLLPMEADESLLNCRLHFYFTSNRRRAVKWVLYRLNDKEFLSSELFDQWQKACETEIKRTQKSGYKKFHSSLFYDTVMINELREVIFKEAFG
jgi:hypothetical protein